MGTRSYDSTKLERILHLYMAIKASPDKSPKEIRQELGVEKSAYGRYCTLLKGLGVEFHFDRKARRHVVEKDAFLTAPDLTLDERLAIVLAVGRLGGLQESFLASCARKAATKLLVVNKASMVAACSALLKGPELPTHVGGKEVVVDSLFKAITERRRVRIEYHKPHADPVEYEVDPYQLYVLEGALYLDGYHWKRKAVRCFKVCRIKQIWSTEIIFSNERGYVYEERRMSSFCRFATDNEPETVRIWFSPFAAPYIREEYRHPNQSLMDNADGSLIFEVKVTEPREVLWWAMRWGADFEVLEPEWLREEAMEKVKRMAGRYGMRVEG
ncbi:Predicted DNA-binding transcriptional regulator YafY, contains an HTH and WYL domains [Desulfomicrobium norvegicum]|uniref:Predicted DNA-binding transcriptional regulator YafY, contains an HTH and WYL domains n=1 Tax=Desulfomicrobium norvegicum (strain DSM 1741 / NCIMB 8310) TaxID=52561 RepID=A0A8G2C436_DESNO|nr:WYL domain-containing protein [Desulfomicrobium norvegicum]SFL91455.1 Predicted DNA-binding transcriptional regulator YafY, contains an HTH and WYL domains [Desulfomicrobium norvegicum]